MEQGIDMACSAVRKLLSEREALVDQSYSLERFKNEIAVETLYEVLSCVESCKNNL